METVPNREGTATNAGTARVSADLTAILRRRWWIIALIVAGAVIVTLIVSLSAPSRYRSSMRLQAFALDDQEVTLYTRLPSVNPVDRITITQNSFAEVLRSPLIAWRTVNDLGLDMSAGELLDNLRVNVSFEFVDVIYEAETAQLAQDVLARQVQNALDQFNSQQSLPAVETGQFVQAELDEQGRILTTAREALLRFQLEHGVGDLPREINAMQDVLRTLEAGRDSALVEAERAATLASQWEDYADQALAGADAAQEELSALLAPETAEAAPVAEAANSPEQVAATVASLQTTIEDNRAMAQAYGNTALTQAAAAEAQRAAAARQETVIGQRQTDLAQLIGLSSEYNDLLTVLQSAQADFDFLRAKAVEARLKVRQSSDVGSLQVIQPAFLPSNPAPSNTLQLVILAAVVSLIVGALVVLLLELISPTGPREQARAES